MMKIVATAGALTLGLATGLPTAAQTPASGPTTATMVGPALNTPDLERSMRFFREGLGFTQFRRIELPNATEVMVSLGPLPATPFIILYKSKYPAKAGPVTHGTGYARVSLMVPDATAIHARLTAAGYTPGKLNPNPVNHAKFFFVKDPDGYTYEIVEAGAPPTKP